VCRNHFLLNPTEWSCRFVPQVVREIVELSHHSMTFCCLICCSSLIVWRCQGYLFMVNATLRNWHIQLKSGFLWFSQKKYVAQKRDGICKQPHLQQLPGGGTKRNLGTPKSRVSNKNPLCPSLCWESNFSMQTYMNLLLGCSEM